jgi:hypothetical protein
MREEVGEGLFREDKSVQKVSPEHKPGNGTNQKAYLRGNNHTRASILEQKQESFLGRARGRSCCNATSESQSTMSVASSLSHAPAGVSNDARSACPSIASHPIRKLSVLDSFPQ